MIHVRYSSDTVPAQEKGGYRHARFKIVDDGIMLTEGTPRAEYGPRAPPPHDFGTAGDEAEGEQEEEVEPAPAPAPAKRQGQEDQEARYQET